MCRAILIFVLLCLFSHPALATEVNDETLSRFEHREAEFYQRGPRDGALMEERKANMKRWIHQLQFVVSNLDRCTISSYGEGKSITFSDSLGRQSRIIVSSDGAVVSVTYP